MSNTSHPTAHERGRAGRPLSPASRRSRLRMSYITSVGVENLTPPLTEAILAAVELTCMAAELRAKVTKSNTASAEDLLTVVRLENAASRAVSRLPEPRSINTVADRATE